MKALVVDDSAAMRRINAKALEAIGWQVTTASGGREALERVTSEPFDLVLTDWHMPDGDGIYLVKGIRADARTSSLKVLMVTSEATHEAISDAITAGVDELVMKPFTAESLQERVSQLMSGGS